MAEVGRNDILECNKKYDQGKEDIKIELFKNGLLHLLFKKAIDEVMDRKSRD